jgi:DNA-binding response OmpR family regulator
MNIPTELSPLLSEKLLKFTLPSALSFPPESNSGAGLAAVPKSRILVAEDDAVSRELICTRLTKWGYEVTATQNGTEAMTALREKGAPSLAILDWMMPGMDGLEVCRRIRESGKRAHIILLTARAAKESLVEGLESGADDYLVKPFDKNELFARVKVGLRVLGLETLLADRVKELESALSEIHDLKLQVPL